MVNVRATGCNERPQLVLVARGVPGRKPCAATNYLTSSFQPTLTVGQRPTSAGDTANEAEP